METEFTKAQCQSVSAPLTYFDIYEDGCITLTEWPDELGYDVFITDGDAFSISKDLLRAVNFLADYIKLNID